MQITLNVDLDDLVWEICAENREVAMDLIKKIEKQYSCWDFADRIIEFAEELKKEKEKDLKDHG